jgi:transposase
LKFLAEQCREPWAATLSEFLLAQHQRVQRQGVLGEGAFKRALAQYQAIVAQGRAKHPRPAPGSGRKKQSKAANLLDRLEDYDQSFLAHLWAEEVPFTNNQAERDLRMIKVQQKIAGCFRTLWGARIFGRNRSYLSTCRKRGLNLWEALLRAVQGEPFLPEAPALGPP